jgi:hypothetical protein
MGVRQRSQKHSIDQAEDGRIRTDTKPEDQDRRESEAGRFGEESKRVAEVEHGGVKGER